MKSLYITHAVSDSVCTPWFFVYYERLCVGCWYTVCLI